MVETPEKPRPATTPKAQAEQQARHAREAAALRENLRRRKAQSRARAADAGGLPGAEPGAS